MGTITVETRQLPVGQGGMLWSRLSHKVSGRRDDLTFVYDCGSTNLDALRDAISGFRGSRLDILFISHLDSDHVNGLGVLLDKCTVHTVVMPYLDWAQVAVSVGASIVEGAVSDSLANLLANPAGWLAQRGVERVIFIERDDGEGELPATPLGGGPDLPPGGSAVWTPAVTSGDDDLPLSNKQRQEMAKSGIKVLHKSRNMELCVGGASYASSVWVLLPYAHPFQPERLAEFQSDLQRIVGTKKAGQEEKFVSALLRALKSDAKRKEIRRAYLSFSEDHNLTSLSLYSGPTSVGASLRWTPSLSYPPFFWRGHLSDVKRKHLLLEGEWKVATPGWLMTGDANLKKPLTNSRWLSRYASLVQYVSYFVLPHHGSTHSIDDVVISQLPRGLALVASGERRTKHPHTDVLTLLEARGRLLWRVSESPTSEFRSLAEASW